VFKRPRKWGGTSSFADQERVEPQTAATSYDVVVDTFLAIASKRDTRRYADRAIPDEVVRRILDAGRLAGSAQNRQPWRFLLVDDATARARLADAVYEPDNVRGAKLVIAVVGKGGFDTGRAAQNMLLVAWNDGVGSCPNGLRDPEAAKEALKLGPDDEIAIVLTFGYPAKERDPFRRTPEEWSALANRKPLDELVTRL
jgi:nitroreductase